MLVYSKLFLLFTIYQELLFILQINKSSTKKYFKLLHKIEHSVKVVSNQIKLFKPSDKNPIVNLFDLFNKKIYLPKKNQKL